MFRTRIFYDNLTDSITASWSLYALVGLSLLLSGILIFLMPELVAYLIAAFLVFNGVIFFAVAFNLKKLRKKYSRWIDEFWEV